MPVVTIDGKQTEVDAGTTILQAARGLGIEIPVFCYHQKLSIAANCRMCLVEVKGAPKLLPSCEVQVRDGMEVTTNSQAVVEARKATLEFTLLNHPVDCPICDCAGECMLQDNFMNHSAQASRLNVQKLRKAKAVPVGPRVFLDRERCINCTRCVRFCREISKTNQLVQQKRGASTEITVFPGKSFDDPYSLCTVDLCPVGALTSVDFRFKKRVWSLTSVETICPDCATGCNMYADHADGRIYRLRPRANLEVNGLWACDEGRLGFHRFENNRVEGARIGHHSVPERVATPKEAAKDAGERIASWLSHGRQVRLVVAAAMSLEEGYAAFELARKALGLDTVFLGHRPPGDSDELLRAANRDANQRGLTELARSMGLRVAPVADIFAGASGDSLAAIVSVGSEYPLPPLPENLRLDAAIVLAVNNDDVASHSTIVIPIASHFEKVGSYMNNKGRIQQTRRVLPPPEGCGKVHVVLATMAASMGKPLGYGAFMDVQAKALASLEKKEAADA